MNKEWMIKLNKTTYKITAETYNFCTAKMSVNKKTGETVPTECRYHTSLAQVLKALLDRHSRSGECAAVNLTSLVKRLEETGKSLEKFGNVIQRDCCKATASQRDLPDYE